MDKDKMIQLINQFLKKKAGSGERMLFRKLLLDDKNKNSFINLITNMDEEYIGEAIKETVSHAFGGKTEALYRMRRFSKFLNEEGLHYNVEWPPIDDIGNRYERILFILRETQTSEGFEKQKGTTIANYLASRLWVNERSIEDDFSYITPPGDVSTDRTIFQKSLTINGMKRSKGIVEFASTAHPFFLIENLTSLLVLFEALLEKARTLPYREQAMITARRIWKQLTLYAQNRIETLLREAYQDGSEELLLFSKMKEATDLENKFEMEMTDHISPVSYLLDSMKQEKPCRVEYLKSGWELSAWSGTVKNTQIRGGEFAIEEENLKIPYDDIVSVTLL